MDWETLEKILKYLGGAAIVALIIGLLDKVLSLINVRLNLRPQRRKQDTDDSIRASELLKKAKDCWHEAKLIQVEKSSPDSTEELQDLEKRQEERREESKKTQEEKLKNIWKEEDETLKIKQALEEHLEKVRKQEDVALKMKELEEGESRKNIMEEKLEKLREERNALEKEQEKDHESLEKALEKEHKALEKTLEEGHKTWEQAQKEKLEKKEKLIDECKDYLDDIANLDLLKTEQYLKGFLHVQSVRSGLEEEGFSTRVGNELNRVEGRLGWIVYRKTYVRNWRILHFPLHRLSVPTRLLHHVLNSINQGDDLVELLSKVASHRSALNYAPRSLQQVNHPVWTFGSRSAEVLGDVRADTGIQE